MDEKLNPKALGYAAAIISGICMLLLGILGNLGIYTGAADIMQEMHIFFSLSITGIITGIIEAVIWGFIVGYVFAYIYNKFV